MTNSSSESDSESEDECVSGGSLHLQPVLPERRRRLLARSGFKIENDSVLIDNNIRQQRELCGCDCQGICYPETCACHSNGIGCQVRPFRSLSENMELFRSTDCPFRAAVHEINVGIHLEEHLSTSNALKIIFTKQ